MKIPGNIVDLMTNRMIVFMRSTSQFNQVIRKTIKYDDSHYCMEFIDDEPWTTNSKQRTMDTVTSAISNGRAIWDQKHKQQNCWQLCGQLDNSWKKSESSGLTIESLLPKVQISCTKNLEYIWSGWCNCGFKQFHWVDYKKLLSIEFL